MLFTAILRGILHKEDTEKEWFKFGLNPLDLLRQRPSDQDRIIFKKVWFSDLETLEICGQVNREEYFQELSSQFEKHNIEKQNYTALSTTTSMWILMLMQEERKSVELIKKIWLKKDYITLLNESRLKQRQTINRKSK